MPEKADVFSLAVIVHALPLNRATLNFYWVVQVS